MFDNSIDSAKKNFIKYLDNLGVSPKTHKNYRSDLTHFTGWLILRVRSFGSYIESLTDGVPFINKNLLIEYKSYLSENNIPNKTINRRLSTLRHLAKFMVLENLIDQNFMDGIENIANGKIFKLTRTPIIEEYRGYLEAEKVSRNTVKNYVSDVRQFLNWLESNQQIINS